MVHRRYGPADVLELADVERPKVGPTDVLVRVSATTVNYGDVVARNFGNMPAAQFNMPWLFWLAARIDFGLSNPRRPVLGNEFAGIVEAVGAQVTAFSKGDRVFGWSGPKMGAYAELLCIDHQGCLAHVPAKVSLSEAAAVPYGAVMALGLLRKAGVTQGTRLAVLGASGNIGLAAVQLACALGADVVAVCGPSGQRVVLDAGARRAIDYTSTDWTASHETFDVVLDVLGRSDLRAAARVLSPNAHYVYASFKLRHLIASLTTRFRSGPRVSCAIADGTREDLLAITTLLERGQFRPLVDTSYEWSALPEAHRRVERGSRSGSVVVTLPALG